MVHVIFFWGVRFLQKLLVKTGRSKENMLFMVAAVRSVRVESINSSKNWGMRKFQLKNDGNLGFALKNHLSFNPTKIGLTKMKDTWVPMVVGMQVFQDANGK